MTKDPGPQSLILKDLAAKFQKLERRVDKHATDVKVASEIIRQLLEPAPEPPKRTIGFRVAR